MIEIIIKLLEVTKSKDEKINILKGKYKIPETFKEGRKQLNMQRDGKH